MLQCPHSCIQPCKGLDSASGFVPFTSTWGFIPWVHRPHLCAVAETVMKQKARQGAEQGSLPEHLCTQVCNPT